MKSARGRMFRSIDVVAVGIRAASVAALVIIAAACSGSHTGQTSALPALSSGGSTNAASLARAAATGSPADVLAIDAGGPASGAFSADEDYAAGGTWTYTTASTINTGGTTNPPPQAVLASQRSGSTITYTLPGLTAGAAYTVRLSFAELYFQAAGLRRFNVALNGTSVLTSFDVFAQAGAADKAVIESFTATANSAGKITLVLTAVTNYATINAIEIAPAGATPAPTTAPSTTPGSGVFINAGGAATGNFAADAGSVSGGTWTYSTTHAIDVSGVTNPAPAAVYADARQGPTVAYTVGGLTAGGAYTVRLDFAELYFNAAGQRVFNISLNGTQAASKFDVYAAAGAQYKAVAQSFNATANASGAIAIVLTATTNNALLNGIEITPAGGAPTPTPTPTAAPSAGFNDYATFGYDNQRDIFNPNSTAITPANIGKLHVAWQSAVGGGTYGVQSQPILATEIPGHTAVLYVGDGKGAVYGYDGLSGALIWTTKIGVETYTACGGTSYFGMGGTAAYDAGSKSLYIVGNTNANANAYPSNALYHLDGATGKILGEVDFAPVAAGPTEINFSHTSVTLANGVAYVGTGTTCDISSWRGRVAAIDVPAMTLANTFFTLWDPQNTRGAGAQPWGGGGVWGWGGVSLDFNGNVLTGVGNADDGDSTFGTLKAPFVYAPKEYSGYAESLLELTPSLGAAIAAQHPIPTTIYNTGVSNDLDIQGTPLVIRPNGAGCDTMIALQGKSGELTLYNESRLSQGFAAQYQLSPSTYEDGYLGDPAYSPATGLIYAPVASSVSPTLFAPGLIAIDPGCGSPAVAWHAAFGNDSSPSGQPRSVPAVSAGGVVFESTVNGNGGSVWALNASTGALLNGGTALLQTGGRIRAPATIDGDWVFIVDTNGNLYGLTTDSSVKAIQTQLRASSAASNRVWRPAAHP